MRAVLVFLALAGTVVAAPSLRWLDATGGFRSAGVERLIAESGTSLKVELQPSGEETSSKPRILDLPLAQVLEFVREDSGDMEQKRLLEARTAVRAGVDLKQAGATLDLLSKKAREPWVREYAAAFRAIAARKRGDSDALERITRFLGAHPDSRFVSELIRERAWIESLACGDQMDIFEPYATAFEEIGKRGGPLRVQYECVRDAAIRNSQTHEEEMGRLRRSLRTALRAKRPNPSITEQTVQLSADADWKIVVVGYKWREAIKAEVPMQAFRGMLREIESGADLFLPDTRVDLRLEQGALATATKRYDDAERYYTLASREKASHVRRFRLGRAQRELERVREKR